MQIIGMTHAHAFAAGHKHMSFMAGPHAAVHLLADGGAVTP